MDKAISKIPQEESTILIDAGWDFKGDAKGYSLHWGFCSLYRSEYCKWKYTIRKNIGTIEKELDENTFVRCHRS